MSSPSIAENLQGIRERIARAAGRAGRSPDDVTLIAVSKTFPAEAIRSAYAAGVRHFGENRVQEWEGKQPLVCDLDATWHLVGHLQSNKARRAAALFHCIDSVDRVDLAERLNRAAEEFAAEQAQHAAPLHTVWNRPRALLIEVRLAPEETKSGVEERDLPKLAETVVALPNLDLRGLMCVPPFLEDVERVRPYFRRLRELRDDLQQRLGRALPELSMGMSHDFEVAIEEGATQVRLGTAIFGTRAK